MNSTDQMTKEFPELFQGIGCLARPYHMVLREEATPVVQPVRRVPLALREPLREELDRMERAGIIIKVSEPTDWVSPFVAARKKDGKLRICIDPRRINACIKREHYQLPKREDIEAELAGATFFTRLDAYSGFHQIPLDDATSRICTIGTPFGRYRFLRLPFGIASAPEVFQKAMNEILDQAPGVRIYIDDILVWGSTREEHDSRLRTVLNLARKAGLTFNATKCRFGVTKIDFLGDVISQHGISPNPTMTSALSEMPQPSDKAGVQRMLGVVNYFGKYIPHLAERTTLLRSLIKKDTVFEWSQNHCNEWQAICRILSSAPLLPIFDPTRETKISSDASRNGIGSALLQRYGDSWRPVAYASRTMSEAEQRYAQIEKETMAITFGCEKFFHFVYGRKFIVETDQTIASYRG